MKYRLKNQDLQQRIETFLGKEFFEEVLRKGNVEDGLLTVYADLSETSYVDIEIDVDDIEAIPEYDPDNWNDFPAVTPPEGEWMRIECVETDESGMPESIGIRSRYIRSYVTGEFQWTGIDGEWLDDYYKVVRFRPWDSEQ